MPSILYTYGCHDIRKTQQTAALVEIDNDTTEWQMVDTHSLVQIEGIEYLTYTELKTHILPLLTPAPTIVTRIYSPMSNRWSLQRTLPFPFHKYTITHDGIICPVNMVLDPYNLPMLEFEYKKNKGRSNWGRHAGDRYEVVRLTSISGRVYPLVVQDLIAHTFLPNPNKCRRSEYTEASLSDSLFRNVGHDYSCICRICNGKNNVT